MSQNTPVSTIVNVTVSSTPSFPSRKGFGILNIVGNSNRFPELARHYRDIDQVAIDFSGIDPEYLAAQTYFSQSPKPTELVISKRGSGSAATHAILLGGSPWQSNFTTWNGVTDGGFRTVINGSDYEVNGLNFSTVGSINDILGILNPGLAEAGATLSFNTVSGAFALTSNITGVASTLAAPSAPILASPPSFDIAAYLGLSTGIYTSLTQGADSTIVLGNLTDALNAINDFDNSWYGLSILSASEQDIKDAAAWCEARVKVYGYTTDSAGVIDSANTNDIASFLKLGGYSRTFGVHDLNDQYADISVFGRAFTVNFSELNSTITLKFKQLPTISPDVITETQRLAMVNKKINYYTKFGDSAMLAEGVMANGEFFDERHGLDWLQNAVETEVFGYLYTRTTKVPQTDKGVAAIVSQIDRAMFEGVRNGLLAPGQWNGFDLGEVKSGDFLSKGFYIYAQSVTTQSQSQREQRLAPPIQVIAKGAGAIHHADISITFER